MRLATWNVNSIRARIDRVMAFLERHDVDVLAIQETKCRDDQFPYLLLESAGYEVAHVGHSQWNGVAIASRVGLADVEAGFDGMPGWGDPVDPEARALSAVCQGVRVVSLYVPNGRTLEDPHMAYKLDWLGRLAEYTAGRLAAAPEEALVLMGDWNIAPLDEDVWSMAYYENKTHVSEPERAAFRAVLDAGLTDLTREHTPGPGVYTYWDYTRLAFPKRRGMRIDFALGSPALAERVTHAFIDREERKGKGASDHAPVVIDLA
ncbi:exodeoxyribonuclease III [Ornithinimicrobium sp. F0845]|uniref:exodeoxyribonuclease III n=1 Tax=Ornithinimicrobium sp. F0845 TaxID=2926412 RepID=UPI001FF5EC65|nr:exodeoxyribonuclease III [Ornithinimicrobium sp. F0845]MCK0113010.1 exodeoxyribonuclease III [Ornithinimicrobium sp. F0845]